jgi:hypothetical protein
MALELREKSQKNPTIAAPQPNPPKIDSIIFIALPFR